MKRVNAKQIIPWKDNDGWAPWCEEDLPHVYWCLIASDQELGDKLLYDVGDIVSCSDFTIEVCQVDSVQPVEKWYLVYGHILEERVEPLTDEEWDDLYGHCST